MVSGYTCFRNTRAAAKQGSNRSTNAIATRYPRMPVLRAARSIGDLQRNVKPEVLLKGRTRPFEIR